MDQILPRLTARLLTSYRHVGGINNIEVVNVPSKVAVGIICEDLLRLLFPGFHDEQPILSSELEAITSTRVEQLAGRLSLEICKSLKTRIPGGCPLELANEIVAGFLGELHTVREVLRTDVEAAYEGDPAAQSYEEIIVAYPSIEAVAIQRLAHLLYRQDLPLVPRMMTEWAHGRTGIDIHPGARIGTHFFIDHGTGVVIGETSVIGSHVKFYQGVSLGAKSFQKDAVGRLVKGGKRHPDVGDNVTIYANTIILGADTVIGAGSTIGGNVFLTHSVPPDSLVIYEETQLKIMPKRRGDTPPDTTALDEWSYII
jgi:serine O-acetyltransferase